MKSIRIIGLAFKYLPALPLVSCPRFLFGIGNNSFVSGEFSQVFIVAEVLSKHAISFYYLSTFANDYTLVPMDQFDAAVAQVENIGAVVL